MSGRLPQGPTSPLSPRELQVLGLVAGGATNKEVARLLQISHRTVQVHLSSIYGKLGVPNRTAAALLALRAGWIGRDEPGDSGGALP